MDQELVRERKNSIVKSYLDNRCKFHPSESQFYLGSSNVENFNGVRYLLSTWHSHNTPRYRKDIDRSIFHSHTSLHNKRRSHGEFSRRITTDNLECDSKICKHVYVHYTKAVQWTKRRCSIDN